MFLFWLNARIVWKAGDRGVAVLLITGRAKEKLQEIAEKEAPIGGLDVVFGIRIVLTGPDNGSQANKCRIGISQAQAGDLTIDIGKKKLFIDSGTMTRLRHISAILDLIQEQTREDLVLIVQGHNHE
jgi:Fe-S cluster assembly iron-binding protein IscA